MHRFLILDSVEYSHQERDETRRRSMKKKVLAAVLCASMVMTALAGCGKSESGEGKEKSEFSGETLSILTSAGWMDN